MSKEKYMPWDVAEFLTDDEMIIEYLRAALEEDDPEFFAKAVGDVARARGMNAVTDEAHLVQDGLYKALYGERDPRIGTVMKVLSAMGIRLAVAQKAP